VVLQMTHNDLKFSSDKKSLAVGYKNLNCLKRCWYGYCANPIKKKHHLASQLVATLLCNILKESNFLSGPD